MKTKKVKAAYELDLEQVLKDLNLLDKINQGLLKCTLCNQYISLDNLQYIIPQGNKISICCNKAIYIKKMEESLGFREYDRLPEGIFKKGDYTDHIYMYKKVN